MAESRPRPPIRAGALVSRGHRNAFHSCSPLRFFFRLASSLQQRADQLGVYVEGSRLQLSEGGREIHDLPPGGFAQHAQGADEWQLAPQLIGLNLFRKGNCFPLPRIEVFKPPVRAVKRPYLKPRGRMGNPGLHRCGVSACWSSSHTAGGIKTRPELRKRQAGDSGRAGGDVCGGFPSAKMNISLSPLLIASFTPSASVTLDS